jgi:HD superfamily phosphohydrolase
MTRAYIYQDPVHGTVEFPGKELNESMRKLIDVVEVQRLRHIRQNGLANLVFNGMEHSRFSHSLGVAYIARRMFDRILLNEDLKPKTGEKLKTIAAALLHDIGHGPFSHTLEDIMQEAGRQFDHEDVTVRIITDSSTKVSNVLKEINISPVDLIPYIKKDKRRNDRWSYKLVSSEMDADRLDYVLRDSHMAGLKGTCYDLERLLTMLSLHPEDRSLLAIQRKATEAVESYLLALDHLYRAVYFHKTVRAATFLLKMILLRAIEPI